VSRGAPAKAVDVAFDEGFSFVNPFSGSEVSVKVRNWISPSEPTLRIISGLAAALVLAERIGRAPRKPTVESMLSYTTGELGRDWVYGLSTALDGTGATIGPLRGCALPQR
jgi:hypothetical protein